MNTTLSPLTKKIGLTLAVIFFIFSAGLFYVNKILLPIQAKAFAIKAAQDALQRSVSFDTLQYSPLRGFVLTDVVISEKDNAQQPFFKAKAISAQVLFFALLQKKLIIPALHIESPEVSLTRVSPDTWNFSDLTAQKKDTAAAPLDVMISGLSVMNGKIYLHDITPESTFDETISIPAIKGSLSFSGTFNIAGEIVIPSTQGTFKIDARAHIKEKTFKGAFKAKNLLLSRFLRFSPVPLPVTVQTLNIADAEISLLVQKDRSSISGSIDLPGLDISTTDGLQLKTSLTLTNIFTNLNENSSSIQSIVLAKQTSLSTASGLHAGIDLLRADNLNINTKKGSFTITSDLDAKEFALVLNPQQSIKGNISTDTLSITQDPKGLHLACDLALENLVAIPAPDQKFSGNIHLKHAAGTINGPDIQSKANIEISDAAFSMPDTTVTADISAPETQLTVTHGKIDTAIRAVFKKLSVKNKDITLTGTPRLTTEISFTPEVKDPLSYTGTLETTGISISGIPSIQEIRDIKGKINFQTGSVQTKDLAFSAWGTQVNISGELSDFKDPALALTAQASGVNLSLIEKFIPDIVKETGLKISGTADAQVEFSGKTAQLQQGKIIASAILKNASIESKKLNLHASGINGVIEYNAPSVSWKDLSVKYLDRTWSSRGYLQDFINPFIVTNIKTDNFSADIEARKKGDTIEIDTLSGTWFDSNFNIRGKTFIPPGKPPVIELDNEIKLSLRDLPKMLPAQQAKQIEALKLAGILKIKAYVKGTPQDWQGLTSTVLIETPAIYMMGYQMADLSVNAKQYNGRLDPVSLQAILYKGSVNGEASVNLKSADMPFTAKLTITDASLEQFKKDTPLKNQQMSGMFSASADMTGSLLQIRSVTGSAAVKIANGYLWELEILSKVLGILSTTFQGGDVIITDADATFKIADEKVMTNDLTLKSATVTLSGEGWVDFDQNIDLNISPRLEPKTSSGSVNPLEIINPTAGIVNIRVYNKLTAPKFEHNITAPQVIKKTLQNTVGSILKLFE